MPDYTRQAVHVRCEVRRSAFSGERIFILPNYAAGCAPVHYCLMPDGSPIGDRPGPGYGQFFGLVVGAAFARNKSGETSVEMPDGEVYLLTDDQITTIPDELTTLRAENTRLRSELRAVAETLAQALATPDRAERQKLLEWAAERAGDAAETGGPEG